MLIAEGLTNQEIGDKLYINRRTVKGIRLSLLSKTGTKNSAALMAFPFRSGILV
ncbi:LuxR C-terminal-related transcriptional regulator [Pedobacter agri]|uniref:LuxR C-terminal-related transcriptional regulator n=1 Tax=Pedobacter agri TaxID=454586 RepID=UPI002930E537|nr:LuxR C-terminal-related transcriptional regulator [Pedobacter agri]